MIKIRFLLLFFILPLLIGNIEAQKIKILLITGRNNHDWKQTTEQLVKMYNKSGLFSVDVTLEPEVFNQQTLAPYDVIVSNWSAWPDVTGRQWGKVMEQAFQDFIKQGKGFVLFHAASATFHDWPEFQQMAGGTWKLEQTGHGSIHEFKVSIINYLHPVTRSMTDFWIKDELWHKVEFQPSIHPLGHAFSSKVFGGSDHFEPVIITTNFGEGRCFYNVLGHDAQVIGNKGWQTLMLRGTEWAATGQTTIPIPNDWPSSPANSNSNNNLSWYEGDQTVGLLNNGHFVWQAHLSNVPKPWIDINLVDGTSLTWKSPPDHPWHHGLWFSWKFINGINYWEEQNGQSQGLTEVMSKEYIKKTDGSAQITLKLSYHPEDESPILKEQRNIFISKPNAMDEYYIDWTSQFHALNDTVILERTPIEGQPDGKSWGGYASLGLRVNTRSLQNIKLTDSHGRKELKIHGKPTQWIDVNGKLSSDSTRWAGITVFDHPENPRHPPPGYVINHWIEKEELQFVYSGPGILYQEGMTLSPQEKLVLKYRIWIHGETNHEEIQKKYKEYCNKRAD